jgi:hypothetical protein
MRKTLIILSLMLLSVVLVYGTASAVTGQCANCHTMHNSQDGSPVTATGPYNRLLTNDCVACHTAPTGSQNGGTGFGPAVLHTGSEPGGAGGETGDGATHAGGDFYWVLSDDTKGHNVADIATLGKDGNMVNDNPPGFANIANARGDTVNGGSAWGASDQLTCAGYLGCHGTHNSGEDSWDGIKGAHHTNASGALTTASAVGNSFRFLDGIEGYEDSQWNWNEDTGTAHNEYKGSNDHTNRGYQGGQTYADKTTISFLCAECHGDFHADIAEDDAATPAGEPWRRHPTDIVLPNRDEYTGYGSTYIAQAPLGRTNVATQRSSVAAGTDIVICLSCHRAHGSDNADLLRWDYAGMIAGTGNATGGDKGCFHCHTTKDDPA